MGKNKKQERYKRIYNQLEELLPTSSDELARMSTVIAVLHHKMDYYFWTGYYFLKADKLIVGPYQGPVACQELTKNEGVCWTGINNQKTIVVADVEKFPGHIACDSRSKSEIVVPIRNNNNHLIGVLDIDSKELDAFDDIDQHELENIVKLIYQV
ncbi:MAG: GAF domain-containing protein [Bacteroidales bacterium]